MWNMNRYCEKKLVHLENQYSHDSNKQEDVFGEREVIEDEEIQENMETPQPTPRISTRERNHPKRYTNFVSFVLFTDDGEPSCFQDSIDCFDNVKWKMAMKEEMDSLEKKNTWNWLNSPKIEKLLDVSGSSS